MEQKVVVIVGGGFAGLNAAKTLANRREVKVLLIDQKNHHLFQPLLYQVATAGLSPGDIAVPIRSQFSGVSNVEVHLQHVDGFRLQESTILLGSTPVKFDYLILACGAQHSYFTHPEWEEFAPGLKTLEQATEIRRRILLAFESAENETNEAIKKEWMTFVIVGGGPTGVELAGAIADISRTVLRNDFRTIDPSKAKVILLEAGERILASFAQELSVRAEKDLRTLGVDVRTGARVENINGEGVMVGTERIPARTALWAAGVQARSFAWDSSAVEMDRAGRVKVNPDFSVPGHDNIFVVGDMASFQIAPEKLLPGLAPVAIQSGRHAARVILADLAHKPRKKFVYVDKGQMATLGKNRAIAQAWGLHLSGRLAWIAWLLVHIFYLIGFKNRVAVLVDWGWSYLFSKRGARLITDKKWELR